MASAKEVFEAMMAEEEMFNTVSGEWVVIDRMDREEALWDTREYVGVQSFDQVPFDKLLTRAQYGSQKFPIKSGSNPTPTIHPAFSIALAGIVRLHGGRK